MKSRILILFLLPVLLVACNETYAQRKKKKDPLADATLYIFNDDWSAAKTYNECTYFMQLTKESDSLYICHYYNKLGPMIRQEPYKDADFTIANGRFCWYNKSGSLDSTGWVSNNKKDHGWDYYQGGKRSLTMEYLNGRFVRTKDYQQEIFINADGTKTPFEDRKANDVINKDSFTTIQVEAKFKNSVDDWTNYLKDNLKTPERLMNILGVGVHTAIVVFMIDKEGKIDKDIYLEKSVEWAGDNEVIALIQNAPDWQPAYQNNKAVFYRMKQSISFSVN
ncbi:hypothetical protein I5907_14900 [Panacibacter sp. DH6]|uniref:TonB C-terminal domain-containing protein n=1 Tax=Panacibacter microcysteis TaxID=2793269 RepID=A0A931GWE2_9BACT|nr:hypothetical protein [Panacibacter microcysteis]MBG9377530.1 hypothetical protein [Panacibacter microcysteis]